MGGGIYLLGWSPFGTVVEGVSIADEPDDVPETPANSCVTHQVDGEQGFYAGTNGGCMKDTTLPSLGTSSTESGKTRFEYVEVGGMVCEKQIQVTTGEIHPEHRCGRPNQWREWLANPQDTRVLKNGTPIRKEWPRIIPSTKNVLDAVPDWNDK